MKNRQQLWRDVEGFTRPNCPECGHVAELDQDGYWCIYCSDADKPNPSVDDIPNGAEFAECLKRFQEFKCL